MHKMNGKCGDDIPSVISTVRIRIEYPYINHRLYVHSENGGFLNFVHLGLMAGNIDAEAQYPAFESVYRWTDGGALTFTHW